ncbi:HET domain-containing protein [Phlyctema vagabunda]|uniref:HET domain-containing protein n=1 Tax=Phlyctema vagabunda TaxID=108571 RepID=A0ABR4P8H7_9HELO
MWLLNTHTFELREGSLSFFKEEGYAILSHRWVGQEITFDQIKTHTEELKSTETPATPQLRKIRYACDTAKALGLNWIWNDTCCINKVSATELAEALNSMFKWYREAKICLAYLFDVKQDDDLGKSKSSASSIFNKFETDIPSVWFSRGWTLQELLAPRQMNFYDMDWNLLGSKSTLANELAAVTGIDAKYLRGEEHFGNACIATKMSWMASRTTEREEDIAYSMVGIFNVHMTPQYGEGSRAFMRLQQTLLSNYNDESLFAWRTPASDPGRYVPNNWAPDEWGLLAAHPRWFKDSRNLVTTGPKMLPRTAGHFAMAQQGVQFSMAPIIIKKRYQPLLVYSIIGLPIVMLHGLLVTNRQPKKFAYPLNCWQVGKMGEMTRVRLHLCPGFSKGATYKRYRCTEFAPGEEMTFTRYYVEMSKTYIVLQPERGYED